MNHPQYSYHSSATLTTLHRYGIGYTTGHWTNLSPPIRGGVYLLHPPEQDLSDAGSDIDDLSDASTLCTRTPSLENLQLADQLLRERTRIEPEYDGHSDTYLQIPSTRRKGRLTSPLSFTTPEAFLAKTIKGEIDDSLRDYPSLDDATQRAISSAYQELHQQVKDHGFYQCRYSEYVKEITRYLILFTLFCTTLHRGWYLTSAAFLGLFWVSLSLSFPPPLSPWRH